MHTLSSLGIWDNEIFYFALQLQAGGLASNAYSNVFIVCPWLVAGGLTIA
jgi:hypothetical protein